MTQLDTFDNSLSYNDQDSLNSAAGGNFLYKSPNEGLQIIENKAKVRCSRNAVMRMSTNAPPSSTSSSSNFEFQQMAAALEDKMTLTFRNEMNEMKNMIERCLCLLRVKLEPYDSKRDLLTNLVATIPPPLYVRMNLFAWAGNRVNNSPPSKEPSKETHLPYPSRVEYEKKGENDKVQIQKFWEMFKKIHVNITLADALILMPKYQKMLKNLLSNKEKLNEMANTPVSENCSAIILKKLPEKLEDPGQFLIPCTFSELKCKALADLGASINLMPFSVYTKLGLPALQSTRMTLELANCSLCVPKGIARDVLVPVGRLTFPANFVVVDFECDYRVPLILGRPFLRTARVLIDVHGEELVIRDGMERIVFKPDGSQDKESIHMMDIYDDRFKDVCEPESNDSSSPTSTIVEEFDSLVGEIIKQKEEVKKISDPVARRRACFTSNLENFRIIHQGRVIHSPQIASVGAISHIFPNNNLEDSFKMGDEDLNFIPNKELDKEDLIPIPRESKIGKECDFPLCDDFQSFKTFSNPLFEKKDDFPSRNDESILKEEVHKETLKSYLNPLFEDDEEIISIEVSRQISPKVNSEPSIESLPKDDFDNDDDLFEMDSNNDEWKRILYGEDFERMDSDSDKTKDFDKSSSSVFKSLSDEFEPGGSSYVEGNDLVCYEDFHVSDALFSTINEDKVFNPGILVDKNSKVHEPNVLPTLPTRSSEMMLDFDLENFQVEPKNDILNPKTKEDFETKDEPKSKKELQVVHPDIEILNHFEITSYVGSDYVFYEDFNLVDMLFPMNIRREIFDPGITFHEKPFEKDAFKDKSLEELAPSKSLLTLDVFDPLHPPLIDFHVTKALSGFSGFWRIHGSRLWKNKAMPTISIDGLQSSLHKVRIEKTKKKQKRSKTDKKREKDKEQRARQRIQPEIAAGSARHSQTQSKKETKKSKTQITSQGAIVVKFPKTKGLILKI
ncbi:reverse transcriptase domain-containing protein [Tanacetum coccineum]